MSSQNLQQHHDNRAFDLLTFIHWEDDRIGLFYKQLSQRGFIHFRCVTLLHVHVTYLELKSSHVLLTLHQKNSVATWPLSTKDSLSLPGQFLAFHIELSQGIDDKHWCPPSLSPVRHFLSFNRHRASHLPHYHLRHNFHSIQDRQVWFEMLIFSVRLSFSKCA